MKLVTFRLDAHAENYIEANIKHSAKWTTLQTELLQNELKMSTLKQRTARLFLTLCKDEPEKPTFNNGTIGSF